MGFAALSAEKDANGNDNTTPSISKTQNPGALEQNDPIESFKNLYRMLISPDALGIILNILTGPDVTPKTWPRSHISVNTASRPS